MKRFLLIFFCQALSAKILFPQTIYTIKADSVKLTNCDSSELIIENHTQNIHGFLFNTGNGRTLFKKGLEKINNNSYLIGADTLNIPSTNFWSLFGNYNINPATQFIGTMDNNPLIFRAGAYERMRLFANSNLSINASASAGTDNGYKLQVDGSLFASGNASIANLGFTSGFDVGNISHATGIRSDGSNSSFILEGSTQGWATNMFTFTDAYGNIGKEVYNIDGSIVKIRSGFKNANVENLSGNVLYINPTYNLWAGSHPMIFRGIYYNPILTNMNGSRHIAIETVSGDVLLGTTSGNTGIGTNNPTAQLHTTGSVRFASLTQDSTQTRILVSDANGNLYYRSASSLAANDIFNSSLAVNGAISAQKLRLSQTRWPDYVFAGGYHLRPIEELEQYITQHNHLPEVPSATEIEEKGLDVGDNQAIVLKKIEELTFYLIKQQKQLQAHEKIRELEKQNKELDLLKQEIAELKSLLKN